MIEFFWTTEVLEVWIDIIVIWEFREIGELIL